MDISSHAIEINYVERAVAASGGFNGYVIRFSGTDLPAIAGASLDPSTTVAIDQSNVTFTTDTVFIDAASRIFEVGSKIRVNLTF